MIDLIYEKETYYLTLGFDPTSKKPKRMLPVTQDELVEIANCFTESLAEAIKVGAKTWACGSYKLTKSYEQHTRVMLQHNEASWHMSIKEIAQIGSLAKKLLL
jgi:hypothetical protein